MGTGQTRLVQQVVTRIIGCLPMLQHITVGFCVVRHRHVLSLGRILPHVVSTLVKTILNPTWKFAMFGTQNVELDNTLQ